MLVKTWVVLLTVAVALGTCSNVLVVFPMPARSHGALGEAAARTLADSGHEVTYIAPFLSKAMPEVKWIDISSNYNDSSGPKPPSVQDLSLSPRPISRLHYLGPLISSKVLEHQDVQNLLKDPNVTFDVILIQWIYSGLLAPLGTLFGCPVIWYSANEPHWLLMRMVDEPTSAAYTVDLQAAHAPPVPFTLAQRARQLWLQIYQSALHYYILHFIEKPIYKDTYGKFFDRSKLPEYTESVYNGSFMLINSHPPISVPIKLPQNAKYIGGHHIEYPPKPLPENLQTLLDEAKNGAIFFSLGSNLKSKDFPEATKRELVQLFGGLEQTVLWKFEEHLPDLPSNVHILDWAPQTSILNHPNLMIFISHGGMLSLTETTQSGVPIIGIPFFGDQFVNIDRAVARGCALRVDVNRNFANNLKTAIYEMLGNPSYRMNSRRASEIFKYRVSPARWELAYWVQYVLDTKGAVHLRSPALIVPWYQKLHLDIALLLLLGSRIIISLLKNLVKRLRLLVTNKEKQE